MPPRLPPTACEKREGWKRPFRLRHHRLPPPAPAPHLVDEVVAAGTASVGVDLAQAAAPVTTHGLRARIVVTSSPTSASVAWLSEHPLRTWLMRLLPVPPPALALIWPVPPPRLPTA